MKFNQKTYYIVLSFFAIASFISIILIISKTNIFKNKKILPSFKAEGAFIIESESQVDSSGSFQAQVIADSDGKEANSVALYIKFDPEKIRVVNIDTSASFCQFYPQNKFDNTAGTISIQCGSPSPGFKGQDTIVSIEFMPLNIGQTNIEILEKSMILLNNGKGENIFSQGLKHPITILNTI